LLARIGARLRLERQRHGLSLRAFARQMGYTHPTIQAIEAGQVNVPLLTLAHLARGLGLSVGDLLLPFTLPTVLILEAVAGHYAARG
jgi:transcriptional regulator with XRE-family HTH domain